MTDDLRGLEVDAGCDAGAGDIGRDPGIGVLLPVGWEECFFLCFFRDDSFPLASEAERLGDPGLLRDLFFNGSECLGRPEGVLVPFDEVPDGSFDSNLALFFASSSLRLSISLCFSSSDVSSSLYSSLVNGPRFQSEHAYRRGIWIARIALINRHLLSFCERLFDTLAQFLSSFRLPSFFGKFLINLSLI